MVSLGSLLVAAPGFAQPGPASTGTSTAAARSESGVSAEQLERLRQDITDRLRLELKAELRDELLDELEEARGQELSPEPAAISEDAFAEEGWAFEEPVRPQLNLLELHGYFRFRYDFFADLDLDTYYKRGGANSDSVGQGNFVPGFSPPTSVCNTDVRNRGSGTQGSDDYVAPADSCFNEEGDSNTMSGANIRFRLEPTLNVYEDIKIRSQIDILDNLVLGSTPDTLYSPTPVAALSQTQIAPTAGVNTLLRDSIRVKRVWAEVMTPLGELSFGRMPNNVGMGIMANDGSGIDRDYGDTVDRVMFAANIGDFLIAPAFDWAASGATSTNLMTMQGQPFNRDEADDVRQYTLTVSKVDSLETRQRKLANDEAVFDFGTQLMLKTQELESEVVSDSGVADQATTTNIVKRDATLFQYSLWGELRVDNFTLQAEYSGIVGTIGNVGATGTYQTVDSDGASTLDEVEINQHGGALRGGLKLLDDKLTIELLLLAASGDGAPGWGVYPLLDQETSNGSWDGNQAGDGSITNFRFDPDFVVDLIFWRQMVGLVTDALVVRPSLQYDVSNELGGRVDIIYSRSWFAESTPSGSFLTESTLDDGPDENLGVEGDVTLFYRDEQGFNALLQYGIFIPMDGMDRLNAVEATVDSDGTAGQTPVRRFDSQIAHTIQLLLGVTF